MAPAPIILILGSGANIGAAVANRFDKLGYQVALVSRQGGDAPARTPEGYLKIRADLADADAYAGIYSSVREILGGMPSVVVFNAASVTPAAEPGNMFSVPLDGFQRDFDVSVKGAYVAAREAYRLWSSESESGANDGGTKRQFIFTGNMLARAILPVPDFATLGIAKSASAFWLGLADKLYKEKGFRFFVADQRVAGGAPAVKGTDAEAHAELFARVARDPEPWPFYITFVDGTKHEKFENGSWEE
ncbi:hypothetical protein DL769_007996 [Monosporascus sp. CRB-8-3]|nr:hypothetical protein DL769_007996 [Monosporascus sp. CRB-8-3]